MYFQSPAKIVFIAIWLIIPFLHGNGQMVNRKTVEIRVDPSNVVEGEAANNCFSNVTFLPLETTKQSIFQNISQLEVTDKYYLIWDDVSNSIVIFNKKGKFISKISNTDKQVDVPFKRISHFNVDEKKGELFFNDSQSKFLYYYTLDGKFVKRIDRPKYWGLYYITREGFSAYILGYNLAYAKALKNSPHNLLVERSGQIDSYLPFDTSAIKYRDVYAAGQGFFNNQDGIIHSTVTYNYNVYSIDDSANVWNSYRFVLPAINTVPDDFLLNHSYNGNRIGYTEAKKEVVFGITDFYKLDDKIVFKFLSRAGFKIFSYDVRTGNVISLSDITLDKLTHELPLLSRICAIDKHGRLISHVTAPGMFSFRSNLITDTKWDSDLPSHLKTFFKSNAQQNPVLTLLTLK